MEEKSTKVVLSNDDVEEIKTYIKEADNQLEKLNGKFSLLEQKSEQKKFDKILRNLKKIFRRIDVKSGPNFFKMLLFIGMAWTIVRFSGDINAKIVSALTFFAGLVVDMMLLRKQLPQVGYTTLRLLAGVFTLVFWGIIGLLVANMMSVSMGGEVQGFLGSFINRALYACGGMSTFLEFVNSVAIDD